MKKVIMAFVFAFLVCAILTFALVRALADNEKYVSDLERYASQLPEVERQLKKKCAGDCIQTKESYGWKCVEIKTGRVFKVKLKENIYAKR